MTSRHEREFGPIELVIAEPIGELVLSLRGDRLAVNPSRPFLHAVADRLGAAESLGRRDAIVDSVVARSRRRGQRSVDQFFGEFSLNECDACLSRDRLHLRLRRLSISFGPQSFDVQRATLFVRQFEGAKAETQ